MASHGRRAALKSLVLVCCLSSALAAASPSQLSRPVQSGLWSQTVEVVIRGPAEWLRALREMFSGHSSELRRVRP
jgi:hypothetical protein